MCPIIGNIGDIQLEENRNKEVCEEDQFDKLYHRVYLSFFEWINSIINLDLVEFVDERSI